MPQQLSSILLPGTGVIIERATGKRGKMESRFVGSFHDKFILIEVPMNGGFPFLIPSDTHCIIRFIHQGEVIGFRTTIVSLQFSPLPIATLLYPSQIERIAVRKQERIACSWEANLTFQPVREPLSPPEESDPAPEVSDSSPKLSVQLASLISDISDGGCYAVIPLFGEGISNNILSPIRQSIPAELYSNYGPEFLKSWLTAGRVVTLDIKTPLPSDRQFEGIKATVQWGSRLVEHFSIGLRFENPPEDFISAIRDNITFYNTYYSAPDLSV